MFCQTCGAQVTGSFCTKCGARAGQPHPPVQPGAPPPSYAPPPPPPQYAPPPQAYAQPLPPPASSGSGLKILFIVLGVMAFLGMIGIAGLWYGWHMVKQTAASKGFDLNGLTEQHGPGRRLDACELLTREDLSQILRLPVERSDGTGRSTQSNCSYYSSAAAQRGADEATEAFRKMQETSAKSGTTKAEQEEALKNLGTMIRGMSGAAAGAANGPVLTIEVHSDNAKAAMLGFKLGLGISGAVVGKDADPKVRNAFYEDVKGLADEVVFGPLLSIFMFRKGDVAVQVDARTLPGGRDTEIAIARRIVSKL